MRADYAKLHAHVLVIKSTTVDGDTAIKAAVRAWCQGVTVSETQYEVRTKDGRFCFITLDTDNPAAYRRTFKKIGTTMHLS
jgi:hypothetical protein